MKHKFFIKENFDDKPFIIDEFNSHHIKNVLRLKSGSSIEVAFADKVYECEITDIKNKSVEIFPVNFIREIKKNLPEFILLQAIPKLNKFDIILEKCTELGIDKIIPVYAERTEVKRISSKYLARWQNILESSAKQSKRDKITELSEPVNLISVPDCIEKNSLKILFNERGVDNLDRLNYNNEKKIYYFIGPEGSFTDEEILFLVESGFKSIKLNLPILKVDTAAISGFIAILSQLKKL